MPLDRHMTAQIGDIYRHQGKDYEIVTKTNSLRFNPSRYGITPAFSTTDCWDGFWCVYKVKNRKLCLDKLYINSSSNLYPPIRGVLPDRRLSWKGFRYTDYNGYHRYSKLNYKMHYTGNILIGNGFKFEYYIDYGWDRPWGYKNLLELSFQNGKLVNINDLSDIAAELRKLISPELDSFDVSVEDIAKNLHIEDVDDLWWL